MSSQTSSPETASVPKILVRNYDPARDFPDIKRNLMAAGAYREGQDNKDRLDDFVSRMPSAVVVAHFENSETIECVVYLPDSAIPLLSRFALNPDCPYPKEVTKAIHNACFDILRDRGAPHIEELYDYGSWPREMWEGLGFREAWTLTGVIRPLWNDDGTPYPNIS